MDEIVYPNIFFSLMKVCGDFFTTWVKTKFCISLFGEVLVQRKFLAAWYNVHVHAYYYFPTRVAVGPPSTSTCLS